ncbi:MAG TPA: pyrophosphorylase [Acidimicrobiales bacterium]|nr:pyrophosphorylase [Acidimicrobiales bacterium]
MSRVLSTDQARQAVANLGRIVDGDLVGQLGALRAEGATLSDPNVWDGMEAARFRGETWPQAESALRQMIEALQQLRTYVQTINQNIMTAGGNA